MGLFNKKELGRIQELEYQLEELRRVLNSIGGNSYLEVLHKKEIVEQEIVRKENESKQNLLNLNSLIDSEKEMLRQIKVDIEKQQNLLFSISDEVAMQDFGLYEPKYECMDSSEYSERIKKVRNIQKAMIKEKTALDYFDNWTLDGSVTKGRAMNNDNMKMVLRAFNNECDVLIDKVKFNNIEKIEEMIWKVSTAINKLNTRNKITIYRLVW